MSMTSRVRATLVALTVPLLALPASGEAQLTRYVRFAVGDRAAYGILEGETIRDMAGDLFNAPRPTGQTRKLADVRLLAPVAPGKVIAVGLNYLTHLGERPSDVPRAVRQAAEFHHRPGSRHRLSG